MTNCDAGFLAVSPLHSIFWRATGTPHGIPVIIIHGGPGSGSNETAEQLFDPRVFYIISYDQRGCGKSRPEGSLAENTTQDLVEDIERLRTMLGVDKWLITAGSWGTTLALLYSKWHPERCLGLLLRGTTEWTEEKFRWALFDRRQIEPLAYADFHLISSGRTVDEIVDDFSQALESPDQDLRDFAARTWKNAERYFEIPEGRQNLLKSEMVDSCASSAKIQLHYWKNNAFIENSDLFTQRSDKFPITLVHGQLDFVCPLAFARRAHARLPGSTLTVVPMAGHAYSDVNLFQAMRHEVGVIVAKIQNHEIG
ncbi:proline iminopeptidase [Nitratireductor aquibiodomus]|uniref:Proline iminopeptidase n=1 Tax=Nitratireductor aquibiodomus TaxID=204799 RepID=A0A1H4JDW2_9HYPH|nr:alpha/beta fold hydrolase [Nitratireductor aquibiodomus]SEB44176.1 proline iminopeptidase [Nitratireductor aquibiodomus]